MCVGVCVCVCTGFLPSDAILADCYNIPLGMKHLVQKNKLTKSIKELNITQHPVRNVTLSTKSKLTKSVKKIIHSKTFR